MDFACCKSGESQLLNKYKYDHRERENTSRGERQSWCLLSAAIFPLCVDSFRKRGEWREGGSEAVKARQGDAAIFVLGWGGGGGGAKERAAQ